MKKQKYRPQVAAPISKREIDLRAQTLLCCYFTQITSRFLRADKPKDLARFGAIDRINKQGSVMGNWQLEIARMALYIAFPVVLFHWFNQPENFEEWVIKTRRESFPPEKKEEREKWEAFIHKFNEKKDLEALEAMEATQKKFDQMAGMHKPL